MKSICIKMTDQKTIKYLLEKLNNINLDGVYFSCKKFKVYNNIIIHFKGKEDSSFIKKISTILSSIVVDLFEDKFIKFLIKSEYFYFDKNEQKHILNNTINDLYDIEEYIYSPNVRFNKIYKSFYDYLQFNKSIVFKGFITFRIKTYVETLLEQIDKSVNKFILEKEYYELISLLKMYINSEKPLTDVVHMVYNNNNAILLNKNKKIIDLDENIFNAKYLSDISFSSNDYVLNKLLDILPNKIYIHLIDNICDDFINTIKLVFENRVSFCTECQICNIYKSKKKTK